MKKEVQNTLSLIISSEQKRENKCLDRIIAKPKLISLNLDTLWQVNKANWWDSFFIKEDIVSAKQYMYAAGRLVDLMKSSHTPEMCLGPYEKLTTLLLSDSQELINRFLLWKHEDIFQRKKVVGFSTIIQKLLSNNIEKAIAEFEKYQFYRSDVLQDYRKNKLHLYEQDAVLMQDLINGNKSGIKKGIEYLVTEKVHRNRLYGSEFASNFLSFPAVAILKVAWILGYEIEIDSPYIPMELMPVRPLEKYEVPYFFMEGYEEELPDNFLKWKRAEALGLNDSPNKDKADFKWDKSKYNSLQEAIIIENAIAKGFRVEKDKLGNINIYKEEKNIATWKGEKGWN